MQLPILISIVVLSGIIAAAAGIEVLRTSPESPEGLPPILEPAASSESALIQDEPSVTPTPPENTASPQPSSSPPARLLPIPAVRPTTTPTPTLIPTPMSQTTPPKTTPTAITFINLPESVSAGERFTVRWRITGPHGASGSDATLVVLYEASESEGGSQASSRSKTSQSFGSFTTPAEFEANFSFGDMPADVELTASATVGGETITENRVVKLVR